MPQLDSTTFVIQYLSIFFVLITIYFLLSYIVFPTILRLLMIRLFFIENAKITDFLSNLHNKKVSFSLLFKKKLFNVTTFNSSTLLNNFIYQKQTNVLSSAKNHQIFITQKYLEYLTLYFLLENNK